MSKKTKRNGVSAKAKSEGATGINPELKELLKRGYAARAAREDMNKCVERLVKRLIKKYPDQSKTLRNVLDGHRQQLLADQEEKKRRDQEAQRSGG